MCSNMAIWGIFEKQVSELEQKIPSSDSTGSVSRWQGLFVASHYYMSYENLNVIALFIGELHGSKVTNRFRFRASIDSLHVRCTLTLVHCISPMKRSIIFIFSHKMSYMYGYESRMLSGHTAYPTWELYFVSQRWNVFFQNGSNVHIRAHG